MIVGLNLTTQVAGKLNTVQAQQQRQSIRAQGNLLASELRGLNAQIGRQFEFVPYMALTADQETLDFLLQSPLVTSITEFSDCRNPTFRFDSGTNPHLSATQQNEGVLNLGNLLMKDSLMNLTKRITKEVLAKAESKDSRYFEFELNQDSGL